MPSAKAPPRCSPELLSKAGMIGALMLDSDVTDLKQAADKLQSSRAAAGNIATESFKQESFVSDTGLNGIHLLYTAQSAKDGGEPTRTHQFITHNRRGQCVSVMYVTQPTAESAAAIAAIQKTLRAE